jgi:hypothetical protein
MVLGERPAVVTIQRFLDGVDLIDLIGMEVGQGSLVSSPELAEVAEAPRREAVTSAGIVERRSGGLGVGDHAGNVDSDKDFLGWDGHGGLSGSAAESVWNNRRLQLLLPCTDLEAKVKLAFRFLLAANAGPRRAAQKASRLFGE